MALGVNILLLPDRPILKSTVRNRSTISKTVDLPSSERAGDLQAAFHFRQVRRRPQRDYRAIPVLNDATGRAIRLCSNTTEDFEEYIHPRRDHDVLAKDTDVPL